MFGTVARLQAKDESGEHLETLVRGWAEGRGLTVDGFMGNYLLRADESPNAFYLVVVFRDRESYRANAQQPETDQWFRQLRAHLETDPEWHDGEVAFASGTLAVPGAAAYGRSAPLSVEI